MSGRGIVCMFCGEGFGYDGETPDEATLRAAVAHEKDCPKNPYKAEITRLQGENEAHTAEILSRISEFTAYKSRTDKEMADLKQRRFVRFDNYECWIYQGDDSDHLASLVCPVVIRPPALRNILDENATLKLKLSGKTFDDVEYQRGMTEALELIADMRYELPDFIISAIRKAAANTKPATPCNCDTCLGDPPPMVIRAATSADPVVMDDLPNVAGRMQCSNLEFERRCRLYLQREFERVDGDSVLYGILCDGVRLAREYSGAMQQV